MNHWCMYEGNEGNLLTSYLAIYLEVRGYESEYASNICVIAL